MTYRYPNIVKGAKGKELSEFTLAAAVLKDIPSGRQPKGALTVEQALAEAAQELAAEGYDLSAATLTDYRDVAMWASKRTGQPEWLPVAWGVHKEAYESGKLTHAAFTKLVNSGVITTRATLRKKLKELGSGGGGGGSSKAQEVTEDLKSGAMSPQELAAAAKNAGLTVTDIATPEEIHGAHHELRQGELQEQIHAGEEGLTDEQLAETNADIEGLMDMVEGLSGAGKTLADEVTGPYVELLIKVKMNLGQALVLGKRHGVPNTPKVTTLSEDIVQLADLIAMQVSGARVADDDFVNALRVFTEEVDSQDR